MSTTQYDLLIDLPPPQASERTLHRVVWLIVMLVVVLACWPAHAARIKEVASVQGVRANQLTGYGLVVGLDGTGDQSTQAPFTAQSIIAMLQQMGVSLPSG